MGSCAPRTLAISQLERRLGRELSDRLGVPGIEVACPGRVEVDEGDSFRCTARPPEGTDAIALEVTQIDGDGHVTWEIVSAAG